MMPLTNIPRKNEGEIKCEMFNESHFHIYTESLGHKTTICTIQAGTKGYLAEQIAFAIEQARDIGYNQRKEDHLRFIGVE